MIRRRRMSMGRKTPISSSSSPPLEKQCDGEGKESRERSASLSNVRVWRSHGRVKMSSSFSSSSLMSTTTTTTATSTTTSSGTMSFNSISSSANFDQARPKWLSSETKPTQLPLMTEVVTIDRNIHKNRRSSLPDVPAARTRRKEERDGSNRKASRRSSLPVLVSTDSDAPDELNTNDSHRRFSGTAFPTEIATYYRRGDGLGTNLSDDESSISSTESRASSTFDVSFILEQVNVESRNDNTETTKAPPQGRTMFLDYENDLSVLPLSEELPQSSSASTASSKPSHAEETSLESGRLPCRLDDSCLPLSATAVASSDTAS